MIYYHLHAHSSILEIRPDGKLSAEDFAPLVKDVDSYLAENNQLNGVLIDASDFSGWQDFQGLTTHLKFVQNHHHQIRRLAILTSNNLLGVAPHLLKHFVSCELKPFAAGQQDSATAWLTESPNSAAVDIRCKLYGEPNVMWIKVDGKITRDAYLKMLADLQGQLDNNHKTNYLVEIKLLEGIEFGAMWEDLKFGIDQYHNIDRLAVVLPTSWTKIMPDFHLPKDGADIRFFERRELEEAWKWSSHQ
ncbi:STAS/SEC14 domain-containing protein [Persicirhabdus sediminis]|uniref:STAS/SEC14 domain-containing protein n=1 Tax=Persicirhabdus sediminis TaxID=454144 RepID=A0A8J7MF84_9BACT|nr:STAS/SEC14 domain-containing protein [Persicirhabdus sediminis]MBK1792321.1 STAS/SEC14 domain-containing protein [Persicirhabdus sediminis]